MQSMIFSWVPLTTQLSHLCNMKHILNKIQMRCKYINILSNYNQFLSGISKSPYVGVELKWHMNEQVL